MYYRDEKWNDSPRKIIVEKNMEIIALFQSFINFDDQRLTVFCREALVRSEDYRDESEGILIKLIYGSISQMGYDFG